MTSNINTQNINGNYPVSGQDNDSQGFRDNFTNTKNNFTVAQAEITELQNTAVLLRPLGTSTTTSNHFDGTVLVGAQTSGFVETAFLNPAPVAGDVTAAFANGVLHKITTSGPITLKLDWTSMTHPGTTIGATHAKIRVWVHFTSLTDTLTFEGTPTVFVNLNKLPGIVGLVLTPLESNSDYLFEFSTVDGVNILTVLETGPLSDTASSITLLEADITTLQGNVVYLEGVTNSQATSISSQANDISQLNFALTALTPNVVLLNASNTLNGNIITGASELTYLHTIQAPGLNVFPINVNAADMHHLILSGDAMLSFTGWSSITSAYSKVRVLINVDAPGRTITFPSSVTSGLSSLPDATGQNFNAPAAGLYLFELSTVNSGADILAQLIVQPSNTITSEVSLISSNVTVLQGNITTIEGNVTTLQGNVTTINNNLNPLLGNVVLNNTGNLLNGNIISGAATLKAVTAVTAGAVSINTNAADLHVINLTGTVTLSLTNWSTITNAYSKVRVLANISDLAHTVTFPPEVTIGLSASNIPGVAGAVFTAPSIGYYMFELSTFDAGVTVMVEQVFKP